MMTVAMCSTGAAEMTERLDWRTAADTAAEADRVRMAEWLETQARVLGYWMARVCDDAGSVTLLEDLARHEEFITRMRQRLSAGLAHPI